MGGSGGAPALPPGNAPIPVGPMPLNPTTNPFPQPALPQSMKGGTMQGLPSLQDVFNQPQGAAPLFPNSQSFPQVIVRPQLLSQSTAPVPGTAPQTPQPAPVMPTIPPTQPREPGDLGGDR